MPLLLFNYVGFELQNGAAEEMENPQKDVPGPVIQGAAISTLGYCIPVFGILAVLPAHKITGIARLPGRGPDDLRGLRRRAGTS